MFNPRTTDKSTLKSLQQRAAEVEGHLKAISLANRTERKRLADAHSALTSGNSQGETSQAIREQLLGLASKQRQLLQCFVQQKEVAGRLSKLHGLCRQQATCQSTTGSAPMPPRPEQTTIGDRCTSAISKGVLLSDPVLTATRPQSMVDVHADLTRVAPSTTAPHRSSIPPPAAPQCPDPQAGSRLPPDLAQPVPLDVLMKHHFIGPEKGSMSCTLMVSPPRGLELAQLQVQGFITAHLHIGNYTQLLGNKQFT